MDHAQMGDDELVATFNDIRHQIKTLAASLKTVADRTKHGLSHRDMIPPRGGEDRGEIIANLMLAYRHLEDASMRLGKAIQARDGGVSVYDKSAVVGA